MDSLFDFIPLFDWRASCKTPFSSKITLLGHFFAPLPSPTLSGMSSAAEFGSRCDPDKLSQNHRFFFRWEFCNWLWDKIFYAFEKLHSVLDKCRKCAGGIF